VVRIQSQRKDADMTTYSHVSRLWLGFFILVAVASPISAQGTGGAVEFKLDQPNERLELVVNTSKIISLDKEIPRALVNNEDVISVYPLSPNQVQLAAKKTGVTTVNLWDQDGTLYTVDVVVIGDARELEMILKTDFPQASLRVRPLSTSVVLSGRVDRPEVVNRIVNIASDYYPKVINNITVGGVQQVMLHVKVMEVSRTKLRALGVDWANVGNTDTIEQTVSGLIGDVAEASRSVTTSGGETLKLGLFSEGNAFFAVIEALADNNLAKILSEPTLVTVSGRPASFNAGGEFPILVPQSLGTIGVEYKQFGTRVDFVPIVLGNGHIRLEVRPQVSELDSANGVTLNSERVPGLRTRWVDTAVEMRAGQTLALAGLIQTRIESQRRQIPFLGDLPWFGVPFRRVEERLNEIELVVMVRPELVDALDPDQVPACGPGERTTSPDDIELYFRGYLEVPNCCPDGSCASCQNGQVMEIPMNGAPVPGDELLNPVETVTPTPAEAPAPGSSSGARYTPNPRARVVAADRSATTGSTRTARTVSTTLTHGDAQSSPNIPHNARRSTTADGGRDPGMFGRIGYDVLDYKE
jgi:pilus assembly protein CpaC